MADVDLDDFRGVLELNVVAPVALTQAVVPSMRAAGRGTIVNVSSGTTRRVAVGLSLYASTKSALNMLTPASRADLGDDGIDVSLADVGGRPEGPAHQADVLPLQTPPDVFGLYRKDLAVNIA